MYFVISCADKPGHQEVRLATRPAHIEYLERNAAMVKIAGPYTNDAGDAMIGSLLVVEADDMAAAHAFAAGDPYVEAGLFATVNIRPWKWTIGQARP